MTDTVGLKISLPGYSVESATPEQCSIHSSYDSLKVREDNKNPQLGNILVTFQDDPAVGTYPVATINHNYGYEPDVYFFFDYQHSSALTSTEVGWVFGLDADGDEYFQVTVTDTQVIFQFIVQNNADALAGEYFAFRYYIFANNGP